MREIRRGVALLAVVLAAAIGGWPSVGLAANVTPPALNTAGNYAVIGGQTITNTGSSVITGKLALSPGTSVTGFPPGTNLGTDIANAAASQAQTDLGNAYTAAANAGPATVLTGDLGGRTLTPGVYNYSSSAQLTGSLTLDGQGSTNATFIFQIGSTLTTASAASVVLINGAGACAVFWQVGSSATLGTGTNFQGTIMTLASITMNTSATIGVGGGVNGGRALARTAGSVTLDTNMIVPPPAACAYAPAPTPTPTPTATPTATPTPTPTPTTNLPNASGGVTPPSPGAPWLPIGLALLITGVLVTPTVWRRVRRP